MKGCIMSCFKEWNYAGQIYKTTQNKLLELVSVYSNYSKQELRQEAIDGSIKQYDTYLLYKILSRYKPESILEVGHFLGFSTRCLLEISAPWNARITSVDPNIRHRIFDNPRSIAAKLNEHFIPDRLNLVEAFFGPLVKCPYYYWLYETYEPRLDRDETDRLLESRNIVDHNWTQKYDLVFIDGEHAYDAVKSNFNTALSLLNDNGVILFYDAYCMQDVARFLNDVRRDNPSAKLICYAPFYKNNLIRRVFRKINLPFSDGIGEFRTN
jgi:predicted O-methyltransferase YrrM